MGKCIDIIPDTIRKTEFYRMLKTRCGDNDTKLIGYFLKVANEKGFKPEFISWYKQKRNTSEDLTFDNVNTRTIMNDVIDYYYRQSPDGNNTIMKEISVKASNYTSVNDRRFCVDIVRHQLNFSYQYHKNTVHDEKSFNTRKWIDLITDRFANAVAERVTQRLGITSDDFFNNINEEKFNDNYNKYIEELGLSEDDALRMARLRAYYDTAVSLLGKDLLPQDQNLLATFEEMISFDYTEDGVYKKDAFFEEVLRTDNMRQIRKADDTFGDEELNKEESSVAIAEGVDTEESDIPIYIMFDETIKNYDSHGGEFGNFMMHVSGSLKSYFESIPILRSTRNSDGVYDYDTNNAIGLSNAMNARDVASMLYTRAKTDGNIDEFIESIREIAETTPGYEGFIKIYNDLRGYTQTTTSPTGEEVAVQIEPNYALAEELFSTIAKGVLAKKEIYIDSNGETKCRISNTEASRKESFRIQSMSSLRYSAVRANYGKHKDDLLQLRKALDITRPGTIKSKLKEGFYVDGKNKMPYTKDSIVYQADKRNIIERLYNILKIYLPNVTLSSLINYVDNNVSVIDNKRVLDELRNIDNLVNVLDSIIDASKRIRENYDAIHREAAEARMSNNAALEYEANNLTTSDSENNTESTTVKLIDVDSIYAKEYFDSNAKAIAIQIADILLPYSVVSTKLNSRNASGNISSDIINNSMLTFMKAIVEHEDNIPGNPNSPLANFGKYKFRNNQYDLSNYFIEHKDESGNIINLGLFRKVEEFDDILDKTVTRYVPTEYATDMLRVTAFNGTSDHIKQKSALFSKMSKGDYLVSALIAYFNPVYEHTHNGITFGDFFLRTPSDAPKNFFITLPKYTIDNLFGIANEQEMMADIAHRVDGIPIAANLDKKLVFKKVNINLIKDAIVGNEIDRIYVGDKNYHTVESSNGEITYVALQYGDTKVIVSGDLVKSGKIKYIENIQLNGVVDRFIDDEVRLYLTDYYKDMLSTGRMTMINGNQVRRTINRNHPVFKQFVNVAIQEVTNAATALTTLFEKQEVIDQKTGLKHLSFVQDGTLHWTGPFANSDDPDNMTELVYHHEKDKPVFYVDNDGVVKLTGKAFTSDRFKRFDGNTEINYLEDLFVDGEASTEDGRIHLLYGGFNTGLHLDDKGNVHLTDAQRNYIESRIEQFIIDYTSASYDKVNNYSNIIKEDIPHNYYNVAEFALNYRLAYYASADMFEGDTKCYKDFTDFFKRAKEVQGSGIPYAALDYTKMICGNRELLPYSSLNSNATIQQLENEHKLNDAKVYNVFRGVTVNNTIRTSKETQDNVIKSLSEAILKTYAAAGIKLDEKQAETKAAEMMGYYKNVKTNDAQSYITFEEWIRRISLRGQLPKYLPLIERICDESQPLTADDINEFVQVQKNFYYDLYYDKTTNHTRSRQIKNAEFVLIPRFIKGTQLEEVYNTMIKHGIDQLNTVEASKAGKSNILTLWDNDGNLSDKWFNAPNGLIENAIEYYDYNFLYTQQETPQHMNAENKAAIQLMKKVIDNIPQYLNGKEHPLWKTKVKFQKLYSHNIKESNRDLLEKLNIRYDKDGNFSISDEEGLLGLDTKVFCDMLKEELFRQEADADLLDFVTLNTTPVEENLTANGFGLDTKMPIIANNAVRLKMEYIAQALFNNNVTRQTLPGFHAAQVTGVGWKSTKETKYKLREGMESEGLKAEIDAKTWRSLRPLTRNKYIPINGVGTDTDLKYHPATYKHNKTGKVINEQKWLDLSKQEQKEYSLHGSATYIEVRVPKSVFNFQYKNDKDEYKTDNELLTELQKAGLDEFIGYRIPTEGKQSIAVMKVVGFIDDSYGSTIIVPDDWVAQTGSDFDIDSVYAVVYNNRINNNGYIEKVPYRTRFNKRSYISYIDRRLRNKVSTNKALVEAKEKLSKDIAERKSNDYLQSMSEANEAYEVLPKKAISVVKQAQHMSKKGLTKKEYAIQQGQAVINDLNTYLNNTIDLSEDDTNKIKDYIAKREAIIKVLTTKNYDKSLEKEYEEQEKEVFDKIEEQAKKLGLPSYEEYEALSEVEKNSRVARTNELISAMMDILKSDWSLEENLSQSNFREITKARDTLIRLTNSSFGRAKAARNPYDFFDQADNMDEASSGRALKGISVAYNNVVSIANNARVRLHRDAEIVILYDPKNHNIHDLERRFNEYQTEKIKDEAGNIIGDTGKEVLDDDNNPILERSNVRMVETKEGPMIAVRHTRFGWSNDNRNVDSFIITPYCSQMTAHQLDIIKEGGVPNVNEYTFSVYSLFPGIGADYNTSVAFMMQPIITRMVDAYNRSKSIYASHYNDAINSVILELGKEINPKIKTYNEAKNVLDNLVKSNGYVNVLNYKALTNRLKEEHDVLFDYLVITKFNELKNIGDGISEYSFVLNPDKYGAKQTIFATNQIFSKIKQIVLKDNPPFAMATNANGRYCHFLDAIFPGITQVQTTINADTDIESDEALLNTLMADTKNLAWYLKNSNDEDSVHQPLQSFMKYATIPSIIVNRKLFQTQDPRFRAIVDRLYTIMSGKNPTLSEKTEDSFTNYIISYLYSQIDILKNPIQYHKGSPIFELATNNKKQSPRTIDKERARIFGFGYAANFDVETVNYVTTTDETGQTYKLKNVSHDEFTPIDMSNPSEEEIQTFLKFSPAQKVAFIKEKFADSLACKYINVNLTLHNKYDRFNRAGQSLQFNNETVDIYTAREEFYNMLMNNNPFLRLTAMDLIKYAFIVEGRSRVKNTIGQMIPNEALMLSREEKGTGIVDSLKANWHTFIENEPLQTANALIEYYVRSHKTMPEISQCTVTINERNKYLGAKRRVADMFTIIDNDYNSDFLVSKGILYEDVVRDESGKNHTIRRPNKYVNITTTENGKPVSTLYRIEEGLFDYQYVLYPLNDLEVNEFSSFSSNSTNNVHYFSEFYRNLLDNWKNNNNGLLVTLKDYYSDNITAKDEKNATAKEIKKLEDKRVHRVLDLNSDDPAIVELRNTMEEHFNGWNNTPLYIKNVALDRIVKGVGYKNTNIKAVELDGVLYTIYRVPTNVFADYIGNYKEVQEKHIYLKPIIEQNRTYGGIEEDAFKNIYCIQALRSVRSATVIEEPLAKKVLNTHKLIRHISSTGDEGANNTVKILNADGIDNELSSVQRKLETSLINTREWLKNEVETLINGNGVRPGFNMFWHDPDTHKFLPMTDDKVFAEMLNNPILHRSFIKTYLDAVRLIDTFESFDYTEYTDEEKSLQVHVDAINELINRLKSNEIFKQAEKKYVTEHLAKISKNPNVQRNIISLLDGYHRTGFFTAMIHDLQDSSNSIIQIITKNVMADIRAKELAAEEQVRIFDKTTDEILNKARQAGFNVDLNKLIDENGDWVAEYNAAFPEKLKELEVNKTNTYKAYLDSTGNDYEKSRLFGKYLEAKYDYDKFMLKHVNRAIEDNYYHELLKNVDSMRYEDGSFYEIYIEYEMLNDRKKQLLSMSDADGSVDPSIDKQINDIDIRIRQLLSSSMFDEVGDIVNKNEFVESTGNEQLDRLVKINSYKEAIALDNFLKTRQAIQHEYNDYDEKDTFRDLLARYLDIINRWEDRDPSTNIPRRSETELANIPEYVRAKNWVRENAIFKYGLSKQEIDNLTSADVKNYLEKYYAGEISEKSDDFKYVIASASKYFKTKKGSKSNPLAKYKEIVKLRDARDEYGVIDGRKLTKEDLEIIKEEQLERYGATEDNDYSEKAFIHSSTSDDTVYTKKFYDGMSVRKKRKLVDKDGNPIETNQTEPVVTSAAYRAIVKHTNSILRKAYNPLTGTLNTSILSEEDLNEILKDLIKLGYDLNTQEFNTKEGIRKNVGVSKYNAMRVAAFIKKNVEFVLSDEDKIKFEIERKRAEDKGVEYFNLWCKVNQEWNEEKEEYVPNHLFWGHAKPKGKPGDKLYDSFVDKQKTAALRATKYAYNNHTSKYYEEVQRDMLRKYGYESEEYKEWYDANHVYNPNTHTYEPLVCWTVHSVNSNIKGEWVPSYEMQTKKIRKGHENPEYKEGLGRVANYKSKTTKNIQFDRNKANFATRHIATTDDDFLRDTTPDASYDSTIKLNEYELELKKYWQETLMKLAHTDSSRRYFRKSLPARAKEGTNTTWLNEIAKTFGLVDSNRKVYWNGNNTIGYDNDFIPPMPMMGQLRTKETINPPVREKYANDDEYNKALEEYNSNKAEIDKKNQEIHNAILDRNWQKVIGDFIRQAAHYNAIQDNKYQLYFGQLLLADIKSFETRADIHNKLKKEGNTDDGNEVNYKRSVDENLKKQYDNWLHRVIYDHYKQSQGLGEKIGNILQSFTSASYMTLNVRAGIANVLVGESSVLGEAWAREYFGIKDWAIGKRLWAGAIMDYMANAYNDKAFTKVGAIIKGMHVVDYSELNGRITQVDIKEWSRIVSDIGFSFNNIGEHLMQNGAMLAMMNSHKVIENPNYGQPGEKQYIVVNFAEYTENVREQVLREVCTEEQLSNYNKYIENIKKNPDGAKDFAWYRKEPVSVFIVNNFTSEQRKEFKRLVKERKDVIKKDFDNAKTLFDQLDIDDNGKMCFASGSIFESINTIKENQEVSDAYRLLGEFKGRVISVNKKIHGNYGKLDAAYLEKFYLGRLMMQYHKHLPTGIAKRYRREGYFNEERGTVEKGMYVTIMDFLSFPIKAMRDNGSMSKGEGDALMALQNFAANVMDYFKYLKVYAGVMPDYEIANMRRQLGNIGGMLFAVGGALLLKIGWDDNDDDNIAKNLLLYEMDRLASETFMWNPYGMTAEFRKQWSSPVAALSIVSDCEKILGTICGIVFEGEDYDPYYHQGRYANRHKLGVYFERRIPYYRNYATIRDIADNNHYYKIGDNLLSLIKVEDIANSIEQW